jgi:BirA family biotin operon repressor/biotin-[acetyl-CoA-carboxylase] ligase
MLGPTFTDIRHLDSVDSTNRYLLDLARQGAPEGVVVVADHQSAGRGRLGRRWEAPAGANLLTSVLLRPDLPADRRYLASAVVALAAADGAGTTTGVTLDLKWPNDLLAGDGRKVAGILAEADLDGAADSSPPRRPAIVVGVGINVNWPATDAELPAELVGTATSLCQLAGGPVDRSSLFNALLAALEPRAADLGTPDGRRRQVKELRARCTTLGAQVRVEVPGGSFEGTATGLTDEGHLLVDQAGILRTVVAGDVVHVRAAPSPVGPPPGHAGGPVSGGAAGPE